MWQAICIASIVISLIRIFPALFNSFEKIKDYPRINTFLDYLICLVTGEMIYNIAFTANSDTNSQSYNLLIITTLVLAAIVMLYTNKLYKSLLFSVSAFILGYYAIGL